ncbi:MAG: hypothetical protein KGM47_18350 [Acidobacteriota bacterium]|nr:hypothetical protein [Acidobacteriota bacterium]
MPGPGDGSGNPSTTPTGDALTGALLDMVKSASSPDVFQAQMMLLRRLALEGSVIPSRVQAPQNISQIGCYVNLLETLSEPAMREQMLAGILGVAGPNPPLGWLASAPPLSMISLPNDRPEGAFQPAIPLAFAVRSDFAGALQAGLKTLHDQGCQLPLLSNAYPLPPSAVNTQPPADVLPYLGRTLDVVPAAALNDPTADPVAMARAAGSSDPYKLVARVIAPGTVAVAPANWDALKCDATKCTPVTMNNASFAPIAPILNGAGFYQTSPPPQPASLATPGWGHFTNVTGLVTGVSRLGDELSLLYSFSAIASSVFGNSLNWVWTGFAFASA